MQNNFDVLSVDIFRWWTHDSCWDWRVIVITIDAHGSGLNFIAAPQHSPVSPRESTYQHIPPWYERWSSHRIPFGIFFSLLRPYNTKYIISFYFLSLPLYWVLIARSIPKLLCFGFKYATTLNTSHHSISYLFFSIWYS